MKIAFDSPHNAKNLAHLASNMKPEGLTSMARSEYKSSDFAGTHPDLSDQFWELAAALDTSHGVLYGRAALIHPETGIVFAFAGGTSTIALRLPPDELAAAFKVAGYGRKQDFTSSSTFASEFGDDWALVKPFGDETRVGRWFQAAHDYAGTLA
jgi:hypothetical protein